MPKKKTPPLRSPILRELVLERETRMVLDRASFVGRNGGRAEVRFVPVTLSRVRAMAEATP